MGKRKEQIVSACCAQDADAKAAGKSGCGCDTAGGVQSSDARLKESNARHVEHDAIRQNVRAHYGQVAESDGCGCGTADSDCCGSTTDDAASLSHALGYSAVETAAVPEGANMGLGCGNPQTIAKLKAGETVVDLGSGGGFDCFLAARQVGKTGHVIGVDMTPAMISKARANAENGEYKNVEFRLGEIENLPAADNSADVIISNCVINLSPNKAAVFAESFRILKPGGRLAISDIVASAALPEKIRGDMKFLTGCMAGASLIDEIEEMLRAAGFEQISVSPKDESKSFIRDWAPGAEITDYIVSATIEGVKP